jgi:hypothetical protein
MRLKNMDFYATEELEFLWGSSFYLKRNFPLCICISSLLTGALQTAGMTELMNQQKLLTVFAPTNDAFNTIPRPELNRLLRKSTTGPRHPLACRENAGS